MKNFYFTAQVKLIALFVVLTAFTTTLKAQQYTLTDNDVVVTNGVIESCSYDFAIKDIIIPETLDGQTVVGIVDRDYYDGVFFSKDIVNIILPNTLTFIGANAFSGNKLTRIDIPNSVVSIGLHAFIWNNLTCVTIPNNVLYIGKNAFCWNKLTDITIPDSITYIEEGVFNSNELTNVTIPNSVTRIGKNAFAFNNIIKVTIPNSVTIIDKEAFYENKGLTSIILPNSIIDNIAFFNWIDTEGNTYNGGVTVTDFEVGYTAITDFYTLTDNDVVVIGGEIQSCNYNFAATSIKIPETLDGQTIVGIARKKYDSIVFHDKGILGVSLPNTLVSIVESAFVKNKLTIATIPNSVLTIGDFAFYDNKLTKIVIPNSVNFIGKYAFYLNEISSFILPASIKDGHTFVNWTDTKNKEYAGGENVTDLAVAYIAHFNPNKYTISGKVTGADGITVALSGDVTDSKTINNGETFNFIVEYGKNVSVTATKQGYKFEKENYAFENISENKTDINFTATEVVTAINDNSFANFNCYPNPVNNTLFIELPADNNIASVNISDVTGKVLYQAMNITDKVLSVDVSEFNSGIFIVKVTNNKGVSDIRKVIKK